MVVNEFAGRAPTVILVLEHLLACCEVALRVIPFNRRSPTMVETKNTFPGRDNEQSLHGERCNAESFMTVTSGDLSECPRRIHNCQRCPIRNK